jgi:transcriptional regulator
MYIPTHFRLDDAAQTVAFMQRYNFATLVTVIEGEPFVSHLPLVVEFDNQQVTIIGHMAKANPQWQTLAQQTALVVFAEPHAYVSPSLYEKPQNVPTWNYIAVHAYGQARLITDEAGAFALLEQQMRTYEPAYIAQWASLADDYKQAMVKGMVAFEIKVARLEGKQKLSQNKSEQDRQTVTQHMLESEDPMLRDLGIIMDVEMSRLRAKP